MDAQTLAAYEADAARHAAFQRDVLPGLLHDLIRSLFHPGGRTADIGAGAGRDAAWMAAQGFVVTAYEPSPAMRAQALAAFPALEFRDAALPYLDDVPRNSYANVLCNAVLMHLAPDEGERAVLVLGALLCPGGRLLLRYRGPRRTGEREADGRLFTAIDPDVLARRLIAAGLDVVHEEATSEEFRPDVTWYTVVAERPA